MTGAALAGIRVLDASRMTPGGYCSLLLAELGAEVVRLEDVSTVDATRLVPPFYDGAEASASSSFFVALNRGKRSIRVDLRHPAGRDAVVRLLAGFDVFLESFRPGFLDRLGLGHDLLRERHPRLVTCAISGFGATGPDRARAGHDVTYLARAGFLDGGDDGATPRLPPAQIADVAGGSLFAALGILAALRVRDRTGCGQFVDVAMADGALALLAPLAAATLAGHDVAGPTHELAGGLACYGVYPARDGFVALGALEPKFWAELCRGLERPDLLPQHRAPSPSRTTDALAAIFEGRTRAEWRAFADRHDCCLEPVATLAEALAHPAFAARGAVVTVAQAGTPGVRHLAHPVRYSATPAHALGDAPALGADTADVFAEAGFTADEIAELVAGGTIRGPDASPPGMGAPR